MTKDDAVAGAQSIYRAIDILEQFTEATPTRAVKDVCDATGLTSSTAHRVMKALESRGMLLFDAHTKEYRLGPTVARLASPMLSQNGVTGAVAPALRYLQRETGEAVSFQVRFGFSRLCILEFDSHHHLQYKSGVGNSFPLVAGSAGKAFLAYLPDDEIQEVLAEADATGRWLLQSRSPDNFMREMRSIRRRGYAASTGEVLQDGAGVASAVLDIQHRPVGVVNVGGPAARFTQKVRSAVGEVVYATVLEVERSMGLPPREQRQGTEGTALATKSARRPAS